MIVQACINGNRDRAFHPAVPVTRDEIVRDARAVVAAGAAEVHVHVRDADGRETLRPTRSKPPSTRCGGRVPAS
jgi:uncharacterized protein (DUF849 family)